MALVEQVVGGAGTGKTTEMMRLLDSLLKAYGIEQIGMASFSRQGRATAVERACEAFGYRPEELTRDGWFRTIHSACYRIGASKAGSLVVGSTVEGQKWLSERMNVELRSQMDDEAGVTTYIGDSEEARALNVWDYARNSLRSLREVCDELAAVSPHSAVWYEDCLSIIRRYETAKRIDDRGDFADLLLEVAGLEAHPEYGFTAVEPSGEVPPLRAWLIDEAQDLSPLTAKIVERFARTCEYVWLLGDPFQCQPTGTPVLTTKGFKPIEELDPATDCLIAMNRSDGHFYGHKKQIPFQKASREIDSGELVEITLADGSVQVSTLNHKWVCRTLPGEWYATYLMRKGDRWRVGTVQMFPKNPRGKYGGFRLNMRAAQENADEAWILRAFPTDREARMHEQIVSYRFGIPQVTFRPPSCNKKRCYLSQEFIDSVFEGVGELHGRAAECLEWHGMSPLFPYIRKAEGRKNGGKASRLLEACNLLPHITLLPRVREDAFVGLQKGRKKGVYRKKEAAAKKRVGSRVDWVPIVSVRRLPAGDRVVVHSLNVERHHTYITKDRYVTGNSIYGFAGATPEPFMGWPDAIRRVMPRSYRCPAVISELGERILSGCSDYWDRSIQPAGHEGRVEHIQVEQLADVVDPAGDWMILSRTNYLAGQVRKILDDADIPHRSTKSEQPTQAQRGKAALYLLEQGKSVDPVDFGYAIQLLPSRGLLDRGAKSHYDASQHEVVHITDLRRHGFTEAAQAAVFSGEWARFVDGGDRFRDHADRHGVEIATMPSVRCGTIHSVKGAEANDVIVVDSSCPSAAVGAQNSQARMDEELRLGYVAVTRARRRLIVASDAQSPHRMPGFP